MAINVFANITQKGTKADFYQAMEVAPNIYKNHCMITQSTAKSETYTFPGMLPAPREFISGRSFAGIRDFTYNLVNKRYELSFLIDRDSMADDQHGQINMRIAEAAEVWATYLDFLFVALLNAGNVSGSVAFDGTTFHTDTRVIGGSANIDNNSTTAAAADDAVPTAAELLAAMDIVLRSDGTSGGLWIYQDDQGRPFNIVAAKDIRMIINPALVKPVIEAFNSTIIGNADNPWGRDLAKFDMTPYLAVGSTTQEMFVNAVGSVRKPFILQEREPLEIEVYNSTKDIAQNDGVMVLCYSRFRFGYGDPRRSVLHTFTT